MTDNTARKVNVGVTTDNTAISRPRPQLTVIFRDYNLSLTTSQKQYLAQKAMLKAIPEDAGFAFFRHQLA